MLWFFVLILDRVSFGEHALMQNADTKIPRCSRR
jgi:hypothetical protein